MSSLSKVSHDITAAITQTRRVEQYLFFSTARPNSCLGKDKGRGTPPPPRKNIGTDEVGGILRQEDPPTHTEFAIFRPQPTPHVPDGGPQPNANRTEVERGEFTPQQPKELAVFPALESHARHGLDNPPKLQMSMSLIPESTALHLGVLAPPRCQQPTEHDVVFRGTSLSVKHGDEPFLWVGASAH